MRLKNFRAEVVKTFPFAERQSRNDEYDIIENYYCPAETEDDVSYMEEASMLNYRLKYCLFTKSFQKNEDRICKKKVKPLFLETYASGDVAIKCGFAQRQFLFSLSYFVRISSPFIYDHIVNTAS